MGINKKARATEVPDGKNKEKNFKPCLRTLIMFIPKKIEALKVKVKIMWLVKVKEYGTKPIKFKSSTKKNKAITKGKYFFPFLSLRFPTTTERTSSKKNSITNCQLLATINNEFLFFDWANRAFQKRAPRAKIKTKIMNEFVKTKIYQLPL